VSLLNAWITPEAAIVAVDTQGVARDGSPRAMSKLLPIPHLPAVIAMRGSAAFLAATFHSCIGRGFDSFDDLLAELPSILRFVDITVPSFARDPAFPDIELIVVGWSAQTSRMLGRLFTQRDGAPDFTARDTEGCVAPFDVASMADIPRVPEALEQIARAQVAFMQREQGLGGGKLLLCTINRQGVSVSHALTFDEEVTCRH
jgi:hypothetical protein